MISGSVAGDGIGSAFGAPVGISSYINPLMLGIHGQRPQLTDKFKGGWITFAKAWQQHLIMVVACNRGQQLPDMLLLQYFKQCLDTADQTLLEDMLEQNPTMSFRYFFDHLASIFDRDTQVQQNLAWENVRLQPGELTLQKWLPFLREFQLKRNRVQERTSQEEYTLLMKSLPMSWQKEVLREEAKRAHGRKLVRMTNIPKCTPRVLKVLLERTIGHELVAVELIPQGAVVHCPDSEVQQQVMSVAGMSLHGQVVKCSRMDASLTGEQLADFVTSRLETEQKLQNMRETWRTEAKPKDIQVVESGGSQGKSSQKGGQSPPGQPKGGGKSGSPQRPVTPP